MAKCPNCGNPRVKYLVSRSSYWKGRSVKGFGSSLEPRKDFRVKCNKCGYKGEIRP